MKEKRVLICGDRDWANDELISDWLCILQRSGYTTVIEGEARGADSMAREWAEEIGLTVMPFPAQWKRFGTSAGPKRNIQMLEEGKPLLVVAFHNRIESSKGTKHMLRIADKAGVATLLVKEIR